MGFKYIEKNMDYCVKSMYIDKKVKKLILNWNTTSYFGPMYPKDNPSFIFKQLPPIKTLRKVGYEGQFRILIINPSPGFILNQKNIGLVLFWNDALESQTIQIIETISGI